MDKNGSTQTFVTDETQKNYLVNNISEEEI
jgi:hypothetical protein